MPRAIKPGLLRRCKNAECRGEYLTDDTRSNLCPDCRSEEEVPDVVEQMERNRRRRGYA